jgi:hypothetical protein
MPSIYFFYPEKACHSDMPMVADRYWYHNVPGQVTFGMYASIMQTYLYLKEAGFPCELVTEMPTEGIVVAHRRSFSFHQQPDPKLLMICYKANYDPHPYAQLHIVLNPKDINAAQHFIPHWRQTGLIPRDPDRGDRFENVAYFGLDINLAPELRCEEWQSAIRSLGLSWQIVEPERWNDYRTIDAIVAVRSFRQQEFIYKPALKLYNAWHAGIPAALGCETSFQAEWKSTLDYIEVTSVAETLTALTRLRDDVTLRRAMVENGYHRAEATKPAQLILEWKAFFNEVAIPMYEQWSTASDITRKSFLFQRYIKMRWRELAEKITQTDALGRKQKPFQKLLLHKDHRFTRV